MKIVDAKIYVVGNPPPHFGGRYFIRHSPYTTQIRGNSTTFPPPRELYPLCSHPMA